MTIIRKLALALFLAFLSTSYSNSQVIVPGATDTDQATGNLLIKNNWTGAPAIYGFQETCCTGGPNPIVNADTNTIRFSYGWSTVSQSIAVNQALQGTGIQVSGYKWGWTLFNQQENGGSSDVLYASVITRDAGGNIVDQMTHNYSYKTYNWERIEGTRTYASPYQASSLSTISMEFVGQDPGFWAGYYGARVRDPSLSLLYKTDPCATNPAYSSTCSGFSSIVNTNNLLDSTQGGSYLNQAFAVNTALQNAGVGAMVHGFNYGFNWRVGQGFFGCTAWNQDGSCSWTMNNPAYANATVSLTNNNNQTLYSKNYSFSGDGTSGSVSDKFLLPTSLNQSMLGMGRITGSASGTGSSIEGAWATMIYTPDPCVVNPLHSPDCKGYALALAKQYAPTTTATITTTDGMQTTTLDAATGVPISDPTQPPPPPPGSTPPPGSEPPPGSPPPPGATQTASSNPGAPPPANQPPPQGGSQPKAGEVKTAGDNKSSSSSPVSLSSVLNMISSNQARIGNEAKSVVQAAESAAAQAASTAQQQAETVASALTNQSIAGSMIQSSSSTGVALVSSSQSQTSAVNVASVSQTSVVNIGGLRSATQSIFADPSVSVSSSMTQGQFDLYSLQAPPGLNNKQPDIEIPQNEGIKVGGRSTLNDAIEQRPVLLTSANQEQKTETVNKNVQPNELAGRVDIASIATQPTGYQAYSTMIPDAAFYAPKEIYRNQRTVDNARVLRGLQSGSDRLHQEMVNQQYRLGN
jgi:hypothetical protein